jgi:hypothetical protein
MMRFVAVSVLAVCLGVFAGAGITAPPTPDQTADALRRARAEQARAAAEYRAALERAAGFQVEAVARAARSVETRRPLYAMGAISRAELEASERELATAESALAQTRQRIAEADAVVTEAQAAVEVAALPPVAPGEEQVTPTLLRFHGAGQWTLAVTPTIERFFSTRFGRPLPISALGQTAVHDRLGFDHRNAIDVAVHPDSPEGVALIEWLRAHGISFLAFRGAIPGVATGAHVHVGEPSPRLASSAHAG